MSRSFKKFYKHGFCCGSNTEYYRTKRKRLRRLARYLLRLNSDEFVHPELVSKFKDSWDEPTDGTCLYNYHQVDDRASEIRNKELKNTRFYDVRLSFYNKVRRKLKHYNFDKWYYNKQKSNKYNKILIW